MTVSQSSAYLSQGRRSHKMVTAKQTLGQTCPVSRTFVRRASCAPDRT